jgi:hypothetical protein
MAKLEGSSASSNIQNNIFEYHIGGFKGANNVIRSVTLNFPQHKKLIIANGHSSEITIQADINEWWHGSIELTISKTPSVTSPGNLAKRISQNYAKMFTVQTLAN